LTREIYKLYFYGNILFLIRPALNISRVKLIIVVLLEPNRSIINTPCGTLTPCANSSPRTLLAMTALYILGPKIAMIASGRTPYRVTPFRVSSGEGKGNTTLAPLGIARGRTCYVDSIYTLNKAFVRSSTLLSYIAKVIAQSSIAQLKKDIIIAAFK
jgi:hypothetical protein